MCVRFATVYMLRAHICSSRLFLYICALKYFEFFWSVLSSNFESQPFKKSNFHAPAASFHIFLAMCHKISGGQKT